MRPLVLELHRISDAEFCELVSEVGDEEEVFGIPLVISESGDTYPRPIAGVKVFARDDPPYCVVRLDKFD